MRYILSYDKETRAFDSLAQLRYFLTRHIPINRRKDSEPVDPLCLEQAAEGVLFDTHSSCEQWANHYNVPPEVVYVMVADLFVCERTRAVTLDTKFFVEFAEEIVRVEEAWKRSADCKLKELEREFPCFQPY
jgi:hypothetical protein